MNYEKLIELASEENIEVYETKLSKELKGLYADNVIAISSRNKTTAEKACVLAEELGHYYTTVGNILDQTKTNNRKQEHKARRWAIKKFIRIEDFIKAFEAGIRNKYELAEFLEVTETFIDIALQHFKNTYGIYKEIDNYVICFNPLIILKKFTYETDKPRPHNMAIKE